MRKFLALAATVILGGALLIAGCGNDNKQAASDGKQVLKIGATAVPHAEILEQVKPILAKDGIELKITEFTDYNTPNLALGDKEIDANFFQHVPYMEEFAKAHKLDLVSAGGVHLEPMGLYSRKIKDLKDLPKGAKIAIPNDPTNGGRALLYESAISVIGKNKEFKEIHSYYRTREKNPLKKMQSVIAVACKLIRIFYTILTKGVDYDGQKMLNDIVRPEIQPAA